MAGDLEEDAPDFADWMSDFVRITDRGLAGRSPIIKDPLLIDNHGLRIREEWRANYKQRAIDKLPGDLIIAFDRIHNLQREKEVLQAQLNEANRKLERANLRIWIMSLIVSPIAAAILRALWNKIFP